jgi:hypothetical protein
MTLLILAAIVLIVGGVLWSASRAVLTELTTVRGGLDALARYVTATAPVGHSEAAAPACVCADAIRPLHAQIEAHGALLRNLPAPRVDMAPVLAALERSRTDLPVPAPAPVDMAPVMAALESLQQRAARAGSIPAPPIQPRPARVRTVAPPSPNRLALLARTEKRRRQQK